MSTTTTGLATSFIQFSRASNATVTDSDGKIKWAGHNLLTNSENFDAASWTQGNLASVTANAVVAPNGTTTADAITPNTSNASHIIYTAPIISATKLTFACFVKANGYSKVALRDPWSSGAGAAFDLSGSGSVIGAYNAAGSTVGDMAIDSVGSGWFRISCSISFASAVLMAFGLHILDPAYTSGNLDAAWTPNGTSGIYAWGAHLYRSDLGGMVANPARGDSYYPTTPRNLLGYTEAVGSWSSSSASVTSNSTIAPNGLQTADTVSILAGGNVGQIISGIAAGSQYTISVWIKSSVSNGASNIRITTNNTISWNTGISQVFSITSSWQRISITGVAISSGSSVAVIIGAVDATGSADASCIGSVDLWGAQLSDSASLDAYSPVYGAAVTSAAYYAPRLDYDPVSLAAKGLLVEEQRSNLLTYSAQFDDLAWGKLRSSISANSTTAPDGTQTADKLVEDTSNNSHVLFPAVFPSLISATTYTFSLYAKQAERLQVSIVIGSGTTNWITAIVDLTNGSIVSSGSPSPGTTITVTPAANGFYRIVITGTSDSTTSYQYIQPCVNGSEIYQGNGTSGIYIWGAQFEAGSFATSYIPTLAASATRSADVASVATSAFPYSASEGSLIAAFTPINVAAARRAVQMDNGTGDERITLGVNSTPNGLMTVIDGGVSQASIATGTPAANTTMKLAARYKLNDFAISANGAAVGTDTSGTLPTVDTLRLGSGTSSTEPLNGWLRQVTYLPRALTNAELQSRSV